MPPRISKLTSRRVLITEHDLRLPKDVELVANQDLAINGHSNLIPSSSRPGVNYLIASGSMTIQLSLNV